VVIGEVPELEDPESGLGDPESELELELELVPVDDDELVVVAVLGCVEAAVVAPIEPSKAMTPNASANVAIATAATRLRNREIRRARARRRSWATDEGACW
jgi:hypothetical protein